MMMLPLAETEGEREAVPGVLSPDSLLVDALGGILGRLLLAAVLLLLDCRCCCVVFCQNGASKLGASSELRTRARLALE